MDNFYKEPKIFSENQQGFKTGFIAAIVIIISLLIIFAGLTKAAIIDNFLNIPLLEPNSSSIDTRKSDSLNTNTRGYPVITSYSIEDIGSPVEKPVIYLYPEKETQIEINIDFPGKIFASNPEYQNGWHVIAKPSGEILNLINNKKYNYLFWEGQYQNKIAYDLSQGFIVKGKNTKLFFQKSLKDMGLIDQEIKEFIEYWLPRMQNNKFNLIHFATAEEYHNRVKLNILPKPDSVQRIIMVYKALEDPIKITPQLIKNFERIGFTVIEWGGIEL
ncbi:MAG: hypothetical protein U5L76_00105 [Patescibacteria group bacterium]|nr:hypothetical protein [Patescibacteria group bacterium]MDZ7798005.1 hypothetical protein [Patescibacteria group bacterium]